MQTSVLEVFVQQLVIVARIHKYTSHSIYIKVLKILIRDVQKYTESTVQKENLCRMKKLSNHNSTELRHFSSHILKRISKIRKIFQVLCFYGTEFELCFVYISTNLVSVAKTHELEGIQPCKQLLHNR